MSEDEQVEELLQKFSLDLPKELHYNLKKYCLENNVKMKEVVIQAVERIIK